MFFPVHVATGAVIDKASGKGRWRKWLLVAPLAFLTHPLLDYFNGGDSGSLYVLFHGPMDGLLTAVVVSLSVVLGLVLAFLARQYLVGIVFACLPDVEHGFFMFTGMDASQGLHGRLFWSPVLSTEWGLLIELGLLALIAGVLLLPIAQFSRRQALGDTRAWLNFPRPSTRRIAEYGLPERPCQVCIFACETAGLPECDMERQRAMDSASRRGATIAHQVDTGESHNTIRPACCLYAAHPERSLATVIDWHDGRPRHLENGGTPAQPKGGDTG
jgi:hypothetical protein